jgi:hypothetical protein
VVAARALRRCHEGKRPVRAHTEGDERWSLRRPHVAWARWGGTRTDTRIAYVSRRALRVVAGDGTSDRVLDASGGGTAAAWRPGGEHALAYVDGSLRIAVVRADARRVLWRSQPVPPPVVAALAWSADGRRLLAVWPNAIRVFDERGRLVRQMGMRPGTIALGAEFAPTGHVFALHVRTDATKPSGGRHRSESGSTGQRRPVDAAASAFRRGRRLR